MMQKRCMKRVDGDLEVAIEEEEEEEEENIRIDATEVCVSVGRSVEEKDR